VAGEAGALQFQASQVIARLERAVERAAEGGADDGDGDGDGGGGGGTTWNNPSGFLLQPKKPDEILASIQVRRAALLRPLGARDWPRAAIPICARSLVAPITR